MFYLDISVVLRIRLGKYLTRKDKFDKNLASISIAYYSFSGFTFFFI